MALAVIAWGLLKPTEKCFSCEIACAESIPTFHGTSVSLQSNTGARERTNTALLSVCLSGAAI